LNVCKYNCDEESLGFSNYDYDIVIPSHIPKSYFTNCSNSDYCSNDSFHPNCDTPLDTTMVWNGKSVSFEKMGWFYRNDFDNEFGYITYLRNEEYLQNEGNDIDISNWKVVDYQIKE